MKSLEKNDINLLVNNTNGIFNDYYDIIYYYNNESDKIGSTEIKLEFKKGDTIRLVSTTINYFISFYNFSILKNIFINIKIIFNILFYEFRIITINVG